LVGAPLLFQASSVWRQLKKPGGEIEKIQVIFGGKPPLAQAMLLGVVKRA
jgi:hypothetical protein